jgi:hypothetical protein
MPRLSPIGLAPAVTGEQPERRATYATEDQRGRRMYLAPVRAARLHSRGSGVRPESGARPTWGFRGPCVGSGCGSEGRSADDPVSVVGTFQRQETPVPIDSSCARSSSHPRSRIRSMALRQSSCSKPQSGVPDAPTSRFGRTPAYLSSATLLGPGRCGRSPSSGEGGGLTHDRFAEGQHQARNRSM